mmetsp:Transcript_20202/g.43642  ORF Transcript_20202/g.43642 Transcript_20202/m.43642 type:complete len:1001 (+) Transcript_20202:70-3072(+)
MSSSTFFHKPELALRRALELQGIDQNDAALELLHEVLSSRRHRTWSPAFEQIMMAYLDLCLKLLRSREAKDGLHQYRNMSQSQAPGSLEKVIRYVVEAAEKKCSEAKALVDADIDDKFDDDFDASPESILLSTMYSDPTKSQRDSAMLLPSLKFLWETYRAVLDILRSNSKLEHVYHMAAQSALNFCKTYRRRMEFRHLCDMLRNHLSSLRQYGNLFETTENTKSSNKVRGFDGWSSQSIELHLQTRFAQLETASILHRYTEGFRTCEDIFNILQISQARRKIDPDAPAPKAKLMASYYERLTTLFWVSQNHLFHAYAWFKYYALCKEYNRGMSDDTKRMLASAVLLAALCIPSIPQESGASGEKSHGISSTAEDDIVKQKMARMATLLGFHTRNPTREALLTEIRSKDLLSQVPGYLRNLFYLLEESSDPLIIVERAKPLLEELKKEIGNTTTSDENNDDVEDTTLARYVEPLSSVLLLKLIVNLSKTYHTVSMDFLKSLTSGLGMNFEQVEKALVLFTQSKALSVRIDHREECLRFGDTQLESDMMRSQLTVLSNQLESVSQILRPRDDKAILENRTAAYASIRASLPAEHSRIIERKNLIEQRKELEERMAQAKIQQAARKKAEEEAQRRKEEEVRIKKEHLNREREKQRKIQQEMDNKEKIGILKSMGKKADEISEEELAAMKTEALAKEAQKENLRKKEEAERKTKEASKKLDYLVRAIRIEELPLIKKKYDEKVKSDRERYEQETVEKVKQAKAQWESDVKDKAVLEEHGVFKFMEEFEAKVMAGREVGHKELCKEADAKAEVEAEKAKIRRARKRKDDEAKKAADEARRAAEEEERQKQEELERAREEARLAQEAKDKANREAEERRRQQEEDDRRAAEAAPTRGKYVPPSQRSRTGGNSRFGDRDGPSRFGGGGGGNYPGGGRYGGRDGGRDDRGSGERRFGDRDDRGSGGGYGRDDRGGGYGRDRDDRGGGYGRDRDDRGPPSGGNSRWRN